MWANRKKPRTACIIVRTVESISPESASWRMYSLTWARWIPTRGSRPLASHQANQRLSWYAYNWWVCPEYLAKKETAAS
jgi:hypothetical protein